MDKFAAVRQTLEEYKEDADGFKALADSRFRSESQFAGWCPTPLMRLLNDAAWALEDDEFYLEIGTWGGRSLTGALKNNQVVAHVIDPLREHTAVGPIINMWEKAVTLSDLKRRVTLHRIECESFADELPQIGLYFFDGNHDSGHTYEGLVKFEKHLTDEAIIIVDNYNIFGGHDQKPFHGHDVDINHPVKTDVDRWVAENQDKIVEVHYTPWLNGQAILFYKR